MNRSRILIISLFRLGDVVQSFPLVRNLRLTYPDARISFMVCETYREMVEHNPDIDHVFVFPLERYRAALVKGTFPHVDVLRNLDALIMALHRENFDLVINLQHLVFGPLLAFLAKGRDRRGPYMNRKKRVTLADPWTRYFYVISKNRSCNSLNFAEIYTRVEPCTHCAPHGVVHIPDAAQQKVNALFASAKIEPGHNTIVAVQIGASKPYKRWPLEYFSMLISLFLAKTNHTIVLIGTAQESAQVPQFSSPRVVNLMGQTSLMELAAVIKCSELLITNDTGSMHVAGIVDTPCLVVSFGMTHPRETAPYGPGHICLQARDACCPCLDPEQCPRERICMKTIKPEEVFRVAAHYIAQTSLKGVTYDNKAIDLYQSQLVNGKPHYTLVNKRGIDSAGLLREIMRYVLPEIWDGLYGAAIDTANAHKKVQWFIEQQYNLTNVTDNEINAFSAEVADFKEKLSEGVRIIDGYREAIFKGDKERRRAKAHRLYEIDNIIRSYTVFLGAFALVYDLELRIMNKEEQPIEDILNGNKKIFVRILEGISSFEAVCYSVYAESVEQQSFSARTSEVIP